MKIDHTKYEKDNGDKLGQRNLEDECEEGDKAGLKGLTERDKVNREMLDNDEKG